MHYDGVTFSIVRVKDADGIGMLKSLGNHHTFGAWWKENFCIVETVSSFLSRVGIVPKEVVVSVNLTDCIEVNTQRLIRLGQMQFRI